MKQKIFSTLLITPIALFTSCATIVNGPTQKVAISSQPECAKVCVDNEFRGHTPITVEMTRNSAHTVLLELPGYKPYTMRFEQRVSKWIAGNIVFGGPVGLVVDAITGSIYRLTPCEMHAVLEQNNVAYSRKTKHGAIAVVLEADSSWKKVGQLQAI